MSASSPTRNPSEKSAQTAGAGGAAATHVSGAIKHNFVSVTVLLRGAHRMWKTGGLEKDMVAVAIANQDRKRPG